MARLGRVAAWLHWGGVAFGYLILAWISHRGTQTEEMGFASLWLPSGLSLAILVRSPREHWPALLAGIFLVDLAFMQAREPGPIADVVFSLAGLAQPLVAALLIRRRVPTSGLPLLRAREVYLLAVFGAGVGPLVGTVLAIASTAVVDPATLAAKGLGTFAFTWWGSAALGTVAVAPVLLVPLRLQGTDWKRAGEALLLLATLLFFSTRIFFFEEPLARVLAMAIAAFPVLGWAAVRFGPPGAACGSALLCFVTVWFTVGGVDPLSAVVGVLSLTSRIVLVQAIFALATLTALLLAATVEERRRAEAVQRFLAEAGARLASMEPMGLRLLGAMERATHTLGPVVAFWRLGREEPEAVVVRQGVVCPDADLRALHPEAPPATLEQRSDGSRCWLIAPVRGEKGAAGSLAVLAEPERRFFAPADILGVEGFAERLALELERERLLAEADRLYRSATEAVRVRDQFLSIASHELKTPLTPLSIRLQLLRRRIAAGEPIDVANIEQLQESLARLTWLINDLLDVTRIASGTMEVHRKPLPLDELVEQVVRGLPPERAARIRFAERERVVVDGDPRRLEQVVANLVDNAMKYSSGEVTIALRTEAGEARLDVRDQGIGIPASQMEHLFERFYRARNAATSYGGLGLGLYIVRDLVERHGGRIWAESEEGRGSTFHVALPLGAGMPAAGHVAASAGGSGA